MNESGNDWLKTQIASSWQNYCSTLDLEDTPKMPPIYSRGFRDGYRLARSGRPDPLSNHYHCVVCGRTSYPDYGTCAFCGRKP